MSALNLKMKSKSIFLIILLTAVTIFSCKSITKFNSSKENFFEGEIIYSIKYYPKNQNQDLSHLEMITGSKIVMVFKQGSFKKTVFTPNKIVVMEEELDLAENKFYHKRGDNQKVYWTYINGNELTTTFVQKKDSTILSYPTTVIETTKLRKNHRGKQYEIKGETHFGKPLKVDPNWYVNYSLENYYEQIKVGKGIELCEIIKGIQWNKVTKAESIEKRKVEANEIKIINDASTEFIEGQFE